MTLPEKFDDIIDCIERLVATGENDITQALVSETGYNKRLLGDVFQFITDISLARYICQRRLVYALKHRLEDNLSVEDICETAGYSDAAAFSKACKVRFGLSPSQITEEDLHKYMPLDFSKIVSGENAVQMENDTLVTMKDNTICGVSAEQFAEIKQVIEIGAIYGLSDEEAEFVHRLAADRKLTLDKAAEFYDDFKLQIENGSNIPNLDLFEMAEISCQYDLSYSEAQGIMYMLEGHGYHSIRELPVGFFDIYFSAENDQCGWDVPYICKIAEALEEHGFSTSDLGDLVSLASTYNISIAEAIEDYETYEGDWDNTVGKLMHCDDHEDTLDGFLIQSIWELDEGESPSLDAADEVSVDNLFQNEECLDDESKDPEVDFLAEKYRISHREAAEVKQDLMSNGYYSIDDLPEGFFDVYFSYDIDQFIGWDVPYVCEIVEAMARNNIQMDKLDDVMYLASKHNVDPVDIIDQFEQYRNSYDVE